MKKSEIYKEAQVCVLIINHLNEYRKLEMIRELMHQEELALFVEKQEEEEKKTIRENQQYETV
jgi:hypothetical protein